MPELYDERRTEPRFPTSGEATFSVDGRDWRAEILDLIAYVAACDRGIGGGAHELAVVVNSAIRRLPPRSQPTPWL